MNDNYPGRIDPMAEEWESSKWTDLLKERYYIASLFAESKVVLDSCCGTGFGTMNFIVPKSHRTVGIDICESAVKNYGKFGKYEFLVMDGRGLKFDSNLFDLVLSLDALEHFNKDDGIRYLFEIKRVCKKDGLIIGTTPLVIDDSLIPNYLEWNKFHLFMYTKETLQKTLESIFPSVKIYKIFSPVCPYFLFLCSKSKGNVTSQDKQKVKKYLTENKVNFDKSKISNYLLWAKMLLRKKSFLKVVKVGCLVSKACLLKLRVILKCL